MDLFLPPLLRRVLAPMRNSRAFLPVRFVFRVGYLFYKELRDDKAFVRAAGMAYATLIAMVPILVLVFGILGAVGAMDTPTEQEAIYDALFGTFFGDVPEIRAALTPLFELDFRALGLVSTLAVLFVAARLFLMVEHAYSEIFEVEVKRWMTRRILNFHFSITTVPVLVAFSLNAAWNWGFGAWQTPIIAGLQFLLLLSALKLFPCTQVRWGPAMAGAITSWVLLQAGGHAFSWYIDWTYTRPDYPLAKFYGSLLLIPVFLLWLYTLWLVVLLGVEVAQLAQNYDSLVDAEREAAERDRRRLRVPSIDTALEVLARIAQKYLSGGGPSSLEDLGDAMGIGTREVREVAVVLEEARYLVVSEQGWLLAKPPQAIALGQLVADWRALTVLRGGEDAIAQEVDAAHGLSGSLAEALERWMPPGAAETVVAH